ncbi:S66 peptidase family protein [Iodobacter sp. LRB]|uniref:S66 family peptidase n=1 Tax=unclassified Iodobacter TaxID=235634 RepID=UPI000C11DDFE|nr:S66 peptidase family protein [Iodobacter sp. BJB302]PHV02199.1 LD-carboxypeptidase [Iodobacter sp. BJB302]
MQSEKLKQGDKVCVIAPSRSLGIISQQTISLASAKLNEIGLEVCVAKNAYQMDEFHSSSVQSRLEDLHTAFADKTIKGILTAIGGHNSNQLLNKIDYALIKANPKIFCGFSDITALSNAIFAQTGLITYSGPHFSTFGMEKGIEYTVDYFKKCLMEEAAFPVSPSKHWSDDEWYIDQDNRTFYENSGCLVIKPGAVKGRVFGGNLCTLNLLQGSVYFPDIENSVLFIEEDNLLNNNTLIEFDRNLQSMIDLKLFKKIKGILIGRFQKDSEITNTQITKLICSKPELQSIVVVANVDFGHTTPQITFPIGGEIEITADEHHCKIIITRH